MPETRDLTPTPPAAILCLRAVAARALQAGATRGYRLAGFPAPSWKSTSGEGFPFFSLAGVLHTPHFRDRAERDTDPQAKGEPVNPADFYYSRFVFRAMAAAEKAIATAAPNAHLLDPTLDRLVSRSLKAVKEAKDRAAKMGADVNDEGEPITEPAAPDLAAEWDAIERETRDTFDRLEREGPK